MMKKKGYKKGGVTKKMAGGAMKKKPVAMKKGGASKKMGGGMMKKKGYSKGGVAKKKAGGNLKAVPAGNKGLSKLPTGVRNKMGFKAKGGAMIVGDVELEGHCVVGEDPEAVPGSS